MTFDIKRDPETKIPYISIIFNNKDTLDNECMKLIQSGLVPSWYESDGMKLFMIKENLNQKPTGEFLALILLKAPK